MKKPVVYLLLALLLLFGIAPQSWAAEAVPLRIGVDSAFPPFCRVTADGGIAGFSPEIAKILCAVMGRPYALVPKPFHELLAAMRAGELDLLLDVSSTADRARDMDFSDAYYHCRYIYVGKPGSLISFVERRGQIKVAAREGSLQLAYLKDKARNVDIPGYSHKHLLQKLCTGELDLILTNSQTGYAFLKSECGQDFEVLGEPLPIEKVPCHINIGIRKGSEKLRNEVNRALADIRLSGDFARINRKYFPYSLY